MALGVSNPLPAGPIRQPDRLPLYTLFYAGLIVYGSLYPFSGWSPARGALLEFLLPRPGVHYSLADLLTNVLAYMPLGLLLTCRAQRERGRRSQIVLATVAGAVLSFAIEFIQQFLPGRVSSGVDVIANTLGTLVGAALARYAGKDAPTRALLVQWRNQWFVRGTIADIGLAVIGLWALSQTTPLVPSLDLGNLRHGVSPLWQAVHDLDRVNIAQWTTYSFSIAGLALLASTFGRPDKSVIPVFFVFVVGVLGYKIPVVTRQLSLEAIGGTAAAMVLVLPFITARPTPRAFLGALYIITAFCVYETAPDSTGLKTHFPFNWTPFAGQMENPLIGIGSILENVWPAAALAYAARFITQLRGRRVVAWAGGLALGALALGLEWNQQSMPGRVGDVTTPLLMLVTWTAVWLTPINAGSWTPIAAPPHKVEGARTAILAIGGGLTLVAAIATAMLAWGPRETRVDESKLPKLPAPAEAPPANLPGFKFGHPRLPSPSPVELAALSRANPQFIRQVRARANGGKGDTEAVVLQALIEPGSVDLGLLHTRLVGFKFSWRGHEQGKPLAVAYDWLYPQWNVEQRRQLLDKLIDGCEYLVEVIRRERLSPYNVILYNAPFQALMACSLAAYGDDPRAAPLMNFTTDLWKSRVLPVWRQVMGRNGGWHEGGEYVGIGMGQAVFQVPAMWRSATTEDFFMTEPGIRGFLDFLVYRTRPDGTHVRWGDGAFFDKIVSDALPLALEYRHSAAYSLRPPRGAPAPTGWPWGPITDEILEDPGSFARLPLTRHFDGVGLVIARSDWSPDATYVTFHAGDNYWSHVHLDQGAFTIYKGGALAIDSGLYGPVYGSDHHMNYAYQTIAHNAVTVTDPDDNVPAPGKKVPRPIANDGGQRRIGSGWGVEAAPLDRADWEAMRETYHTGSMERVIDQDAITVAMADVTPAYTNRHSGQGTFSARTRRVERLWRTFGYDRIDDVVVVYDQVTSTKASFRKRWLLHSIGQPSLASDGFVVHVKPEGRPGHGGGRLEGKVLLPKGAQINAVGGRGFEFFVDSRNYDEKGSLPALVGRLGPNQGEPGAWRVEVSPPDDETVDTFLVVLLPTAGDVKPAHRVRLLEAGGRVGCEIVGPKRTTRWWFDQNGSRAEIEVVADAHKRSFTVEPEPRAAPPPGWSDRFRRWLGFGL